MQNMQTRPRAVRILLPFFAILMVAAALVGCGSKTNDAPLPEAATLITESAATTRSQQSVHLELLVGGEIKERSEEHTSELQSLMRISYAVFCLKKKNTTS